MNLTLGQSSLLHQIKKVAVQTLIEFCRHLVQRNSPKATFNENQTLLDRRSAGMLPAGESRRNYRAPRIRWRTIPNLSLCVIERMKAIAVIRGICFRRKQMGEVAMMTLCQSQPALGAVSASRDELEMLRAFE